MFDTKINWENEVENIKQLGASGTRMPAIAAVYGVTRQRIKQIIDKYIPEWKTSYGAALLHRQKKEAHFSKWGDREYTDLYNAQRLKFSRKRAHATRIGWSWTVTFGEIDWPTHCPILGIELDYFAETRQENSVSFDRIDPNKGYDSGNVTIMSWRANRIKNDGSAEEHRKIAEYLDKLNITI